MKKGVSKQNSFGYFVLLKLYFSKGYKHVVFKNGHKCLMIICSLKLSVKQHVINSYRFFITYVSVTLFALP